jgi:hypothetical protein
MGTIWLTVRAAVLIAGLLWLGGCVVEPAPVPVVPARVWVPGYWALAPVGTIWVSGHWRIR